MVELIPNEISRNEPQSEILVFEAFKASTKGKDWQVIHSVKFSKSVKNIAGEVDFVVLVPGTGIVLIEAKGATVFKLTKKGWEIYGVPEETKNNDPFDQVIGAERNIRAQLRKLDLDDRSIVVSRLVWFPKINPNKVLLNCHKSIFLLNLSRGKIVDTSALIKGLKLNKIKGACLDVLEYEKSSFESFFDQDHSEDFRYLLESDKVLLSPHIAGWTIESYFKLSNVLADKIIAHFSS